MDRYILDGRMPVPEPDLIRWAVWYEDPDDRRVAKDERDGVQVSTVFLGLDHGWGDGPPILFETMIFGGPHNKYQERYATWEEAEAGHARAVKMALDHERGAR